MKEKALLNTLMMLASKAGNRLFRNNSGTGWVGKTYHPSSRQQVWVDPGDVVIRQARPLNAGLCTGSPDLIGWTVQEGKAIFTAVEAKTGRLKETPEQLAFLNTVNSSGGIALTCRDSDEEYRRLVGPWQK